MFRYSIKLSPSSFSEAPRRFNTINMLIATSKFIFAMFDAIMLVIAYIYQPVITAPSIAVDHAFRAYFTPYNTLKGGFANTRDNLGVHFSLPFQDAKDNRFIGSTTAAFAWNPLRTKIRFIDFEGSFKRFGVLTPLLNLSKIQLTDRKEILLS